MIFLFFKKIGFWGILGPPYCGIGATIRIVREMLCLPYAGFILYKLESQARVYGQVVKKNRYFKRDVGNAIVNT